MRAHEEEQGEMSLENLKEYARRCAEEPELRARAREIGTTDMDGHMRHADGLGLAWTMDDMMALRDEMTDSDGNLSELSEEDLEQVAGGVVTATGVLVAIVGVVVGTAVVGEGW